MSKYQFFCPFKIYIPHLTIYKSKSRSDFYYYYFLYIFSISSHALLVSRLFFSFLKNRSCLKHMKAIKMKQFQNKKKNQKKECVEERKGEKRTGLWTETVHHGCVFPERCVVFLFLFFQIQQFPVFSSTLKKDLFILARKCWSNTIVVLKE